MKTFIIVCLCFLVVSCKNVDPVPESSSKAPPSTNIFRIEGKVGQSFVQKAYLQKIIGNNVIPL